MTIPPEGGPALGLVLWGPRVLHGRMAVGAGLQRGRLPVYAAPRFAPGKHGAVRTSLAACGSAVAARDHARGDLGAGRRVLAEAQRMEALVNEGRIREDGIAPRRGHELLRAHEHDRATDPGEGERPAPLQRDWPLPS
mgnify:CR=1 FL=1